MKYMDRFTKALLVLLSAGIGGLLLRPALLPSPAQAQSQARASAPIHYIVLFWHADDSSRIEKDLNAKAAQGYRLKGFASGGQRQSIGFYSAVLER